MGYAREQTVTAENQRHRTGCYAVIAMARPVGFLVTEDS